MESVAAFLRIEWPFPLEYAVNKLCEQNPHFEKFIQDVKIDFDSKRVHASEYDGVIKDPAKYIRDKLKLQQGE